MGIWDTLKTHAKAQFLDVIQWMEDDGSTIVWRFPIFNQAIQDGAKLVVREGQAALFVSEGKLSDTFGPGTYELSTRNKPVWSFFESIKYQFDYPYKGDVFFVSTRQFPDRKWGTPRPVLYNDKQLGPVRFRAFGNYSFRVADPARFVRELVGNRGLFTTDEITGQLKLKLVSAFADVLGESEIPLLQLASQYMDLGDALRERLSPWFEENYGIAITDFVVANVSLPEEVEKMLDKRTSMGLVGDMGAYTQFQAANAIEKAAGRPGGGANPMLDAGMGLAMGGVIGQQMMRAQGSAPFDPRMPAPGAASPPPPPPPAAGPRFHYSGPGGQAELSLDEIAQRISAAPDAPHHLWAPGWPAWKPWRDVPEVAAKVTAPPPPPPAAEVRFHYAGPDGRQERLTAREIAERLAAAPGGRHLVWRPGFDGWKPAAEVPEIAAAAPPPPPPPPAEPGPPPPPED